MQDWRDDIEKYAGMWDKALEAGVFKDAPKPPTPRSSFFGQFPDVTDTSVEDCDSKYWNDVYDQSNHYGNNQGPDEVLTEENKPSKEEIKNHAEKMANSHNPIAPETVGKDQEYVKENDLQELIDLKLALEKLEIKMNTNEGLGKESNVDSQIANLKKQIDELSDSLNGNRFNL